MSVIERCTLLRFSFVENSKVRVMGVIYPTESSHAGGAADSYNSPSSQWMDGTRFITSI